MNLIKELIYRKILFRGNDAEFCRHLGAKVGKRTLIKTRPSELLGSEPYLVEIGDHVEITSGVRFITHDGGVWVLRDQNPEVDVFGKIVIGDNVFIGFNAILMPGVVVGDNCIIGAGSVVTKSVPSNSVVAGVPAKIIRRIDEYKISSLEKSLGTKNLSPREKRKYLIAHFSEGE
ncbi:acyltransferase [Aquabacterium sp. A3]|uniref:acyltransferase n=1 Tax=Aquabacterium sp. A3 TaxID=3132829 RepID=UPI003119F5EE